MSSRTTSSVATNRLNTENLLKNEGILNNDEEFETVYLNEEEIEKFMERYLAENPGAEIETRYVKPPPIQLVQDIHVRWLRPPTPEMPPIIIREVGVQQKELPPLRIVEKPKKCEELEPIVIRERPPPPPIEAPTIAYVQNVIRHEIKRPAANQSQVGSLSQKQTHSQRSQEIKIERVSSKNLSDFKSGEHESFIETNISQQVNNDEKRVDIDEDNELVKIEEDLIKKLEEKKRRLLIEEKSRIKTSQNKSYSEKFISSAKVFESVPEKNIVHSAENKSNNNENFAKEEEQHKSQLFTKSEDPKTLSTSSKSKTSQSFKTTTDSSVITNVTRNTNGIISNTTTSSGLSKPKSDTSTYKNIKFTKVTDPEELNRFNTIFENPNTPCIKSKHEGDRIMSTFEVGDKPTESLKFNHNPNFKSKTNSVNVNYNNNNQSINNNNNNANYVNSDVLIAEASTNLQVKDVRNLNVHNLSRLSHLNNCAENLKGPVTSTSHENANANLNKKNSELLLIDPLNRREFDSNPSPIVPSITREHVIKKNSEVYRYRYVEDLRIVSNPAKTEKKIAGPSLNNLNSHIHHHGQNFHHHHHNVTHSHHNQPTQSRGSIQSQNSNRLQSQQSHHSRNSSQFNSSQNRPTNQFAHDNHSLIQSNQSSRAHSKLTEIY